MERSHSCGVAIGNGRNSTYTSVIVINNKYYEEIRSKVLPSPLSSAIKSILKLPVHLFLDQQKLGDTLVDF